MTEPTYWLSPVGTHDDFGNEITDTIYDARTSFGPWAIMSHLSFLRYNGTDNRLGTGLGQKYDRQGDGRWLKVEG